MPYPIPRDLSYAVFFCRARVLPAHAYTLGACFEALGVHPLTAFSPPRNRTHFTTRALCIYLARRCCTPTPSFPSLACAYLHTSHSSLHEVDTLISSLPPSHPTALLASRTLTLLSPTRSHP